VGPRRRFVRVDGRGVHYLRAGSGPPIVLLHSAPLSADAETPLALQLAPERTVFAFDHPGFGDSDPLGSGAVEVGDAAEALRATLEALAIPPCPVYGSHTGGAVALELARRHPDRVTALVMDGVTLFYRGETEQLLSPDYTPEIEVRDDGTHLLTVWMNGRDTWLWFPWNQRTAANRIPDLALAEPEELHPIFVEQIRGFGTYKHLYRAVFRYDVRAALAELTVPTTFMAAADDPLFPHLDRLPKLKPGQRVERHPPWSPAYVEAVAGVLRGCAVDASAPPERPFRPSAGAVNRRYVDLPAGQVLVRSAGERRRARPLLLLHDGRGSSRTLEPLLRALARRRPVYAPDLPGCGASDPLPAAAPSARDYAGVVAASVAALELGDCDVYAVGAGAAVALGLPGRPGFGDSRLLLEAPDFYPPALARRLRERWVPALDPAWDGSHLNRLWLMLRDEYAFWPWFERGNPAAACAVDAPEDWRELHARAAEVIRSLPTYDRLTLAALRYDWARALRRAASGDRVLIAASESEPRRPHAEAATARAGLAPVTTLPSATSAKASAILRLLAS